MITLDTSNPTPPFEQIRQQLTDEIRSGNLTPGQKLPSVRQLAGDLKVAPGTVARAYTELEADGLLTVNRTGTRVKAVDGISPSAREAARHYIAGIVAEGASLDDAIRAVRVEWSLAGSSRRAE